MVLTVTGYLVATSWSDLLRIGAEIGVESVAWSGLLGLIGTGLICQVWRAFLAGVDVVAPQPDVQQVFFVTQLGKYLPGAVWPVVAQAEAGRRWGAGRSPMIVAGALMLAMLTTTGLGLGVALLPWSSAAGIREYWWTLLFLLPLVALLHPRVTPALVDSVLRLLGRPPARIRCSGRAVLRGAIWSLLVWVVLGLHIYVLVASLGSQSPASLAIAVGGMALAWAVGLIVIPAPAGAGVRDAVLVLTLSPSLGVTPALTVALASRLILMCADLVLAGLSLAVARMARVRARS